MADIASPYPNSNRLPDRPRKDAKIPIWSAGVDLGEDTGEIRTVPKTINSPMDAPPPDDIEILESLGVDPDIWAVSTYNKSTWQTASGEWRVAYKATLARRGRIIAYDSDEAEAILRGYSNVRRHRTRTRAAKRTSRMLMVPVGDLQLGKSEGGGTVGTVERFAALTQRIYELVVDQGGVDRLILPWLGDCIEGLVSQGGKNVASLDIPITEQVRAYRRLIVHQVALLAPWAEQVLVPVVPGNHDETYRMQEMPITDSWAIEGASAAAEVLEASGKYGNVQFVFPDEGEGNIVVDVGSPKSPLVLGFTHGHLWKTGADAALKWWQGQSHGRQPMGQADIMVSAHLHHYRMAQTGGNRTWLQLPALDGGSQWFVRGCGEDSPAGMVSMWLTPGEGVGWQGITIHS